MPEIFFCWDRIFENAFKVSIQKYWGKKNFFSKNNAHSSVQSRRIVEMISLLRKSIDIVIIFPCLSTKR